MCASVLTFPINRTRRHGQAARFAPGAGAVIPFPLRPAGIAEQHLKVLSAVASSAGWNCSAERDRGGNIIAVVLTGDLEPAHPTECLVCFSDRKLLLVQSQRPADWALVGIFEAFDTLLDFLVQMLRPRKAGISDR